MTQAGEAVRCPALVRSVGYFRETLMMLLLKTAQHNQIDEIDDKYLMGYHDMLQHFLVIRGLIPLQ